MRRAAALAGIVVACALAWGLTEIELTLVFADVRGSTTMAENLRPAEFAERMNRFYKVGTQYLVRTGALIDKFMGDEVIGVYVPGFAGPQHARLALQAAQDMLQSTGHTDREGPWVPIGIGVHTGTAYIGALGTDGIASDMTVLGDTANVTARLASAAGAGEILITEASCAAAGIDAHSFEQRHLQLKGRSETMSVRVLRAGGSPIPRATPTTPQAQNAA